VSTGRAGLQELISDHGERLLSIAERAIRTNRRDGHVWLPDPGADPPLLRAPRASFVTLRRGPRLLGCIGGLEAVEPLVVDVARHAHLAATSDPRFAPITPDDFEHMDLEVSVLSGLEVLPVGSLAELRTALRPGEDGVLVEWRQWRGTFLPDVWQHLSTEDEFVRALWQKAGLPEGFWADDVVVHRYLTAAATQRGPRPPLHSA